MNCNSGTANEHYVYDGDNLAVVLDNSGNVTLRYLDGPSLGSGGMLATDGSDQVVSEERSSAQTNWALSDQLGTPRTIIAGASGHTILANDTYGDSFGGHQTISNTYFTRIGFTGYFYDGESNLYYAMNRYYDPIDGRFTTEDPSGFAAGDSNLYRYADNHPTYSKDRTGLAPSTIGIDLPLAEAGLFMLPRWQSLAGLFGFTDSASLGFNYNGMSEMPIGPYSLGDISGQIPNTMLNGAVPDTMVNGSFNDSLNYSPSVFSPIDASSEGFLLGSNPLEAYLAAGPALAALGAATGASAQAINDNLPSTSIVPDSFGDSSLQVTNPQSPNPYAAAFDYHGPLSPIVSDYEDFSAALPVTAGKLATGLASGDNPWANVEWDKKMRDFAWDKSQEALAQGRADDAQSWLERNQDFDRQWKSDLQTARGGGEDYGGPLSALFGSLWADTKDTAYWEWQGVKTIAGGHTGEATDVITDQLAERYATIAMRDGDTSYAHMTALALGDVTGVTPTLEYFNHVDLQSARDLSDFGSYQVGLPWGPSFAVDEGTRRGLFGFSGLTLTVAGGAQTISSFRAGYVPLEYTGIGWSQFAKWATTYEGTGVSLGALSINPGANPYNFLLSNLGKSEIGNALSGLGVSSANPTEALNEAFHYTQSRWSDAIMEEGLRPGTYATPNGTLSGLQSQLELALPPNRALPNVRIQIDLQGLRGAGYEIPSVSRVSGAVEGAGGRVYQMPGGGYEMKFPYAIPPQYLKVVPIP